LQESTIITGAKEALHHPFDMKAPSTNDLSNKWVFVLSMLQKLLTKLTAVMFLLFCLNNTFIFAAEIQETIVLPVAKKSAYVEEWFYLAPEGRAVYDSFYSQIKKQLKTKNIVRINSNSKISCNHTQEKKKTFIAAGISALKKIQHCTSTSKIFGFYLTQQQFFNLSKNSKNAYKDSNIFFVDQPLIRQLALASYFLPKSNRAGVIYSKSVQHQIDNLKQRKPDFFKIDDYLINNKEDVLKKLSKATSNSDFILALIDNKTYNSNNAKSILLSTYRKNIPLFGGTRGFVKAGIVASCYSVPEKLVNELTQLINSNLKFEGVRQYPKHFEIEQNIAVSHSLNLITSDKKNLKKYIEETLLLWRNL
jgi:hypothetical protein